MRLALLAVLAIATASNAHAAGEPHQWVGTTSVSFTGDGNGLGFVGMTAQCRADFGPGARMCKSDEVLDSDTLNPNAIPSGGCWLRPSWSPHTASENFGGTVRGLDESGISGDPSHGLTCRG
jgi:hypothetical protein